MMVEELVKKLKFNVNYRYDEIRITSISEWGNDAVPYFARHLKELGMKEASDND